jgi:DNA polymerase
MFVGEAPGFDEDRRGVPFVGPAGKLLTNIITAMRLRREDVYITNVIKCRPPGNRTPDPLEALRCKPFLVEEIRIVSPAVLCALGAGAARGLWGVERASVGRLRGRFFQWEDIPVRVTYHPAYLLRNPAAKRKVWEDVQEIMKLLGLL